MRKKVSSKSSKPSSFDDVRNSVLELKKEISSVIIGQDSVVDLLLTSLFSEGHVLIEGVPGLGKTMMVQAFSKAVGLSFSRIQFTPDLMPQDITGSEIIDESGSKRALRFVKGPIFSNIILADEINRTPPKTQAALLEAMQERQVTSYGNTYELPSPFLVMATQNPLEHEGTYTLPEAQLDRFIFYIKINYPTLEEELKIAKLSSSKKLDSVKSILKPADILKYRKLIDKMPIGDSVIKYLTTIVRDSRPESSSIDNVRKYISTGAGPRASQFLVSSSKAYAAINGLDVVSKKEVDAVLGSVLAHRLIFNFQGLSEGLSFTDFIKWSK